MFHVPFVSPLNKALKLPKGNFEDENVPEIRLPIGRDIKPTKVFLARAHQSLPQGEVGGALYTTLILYHQLNLLVGKHFVQILCR